MEDELELFKAAYVKAVKRRFEEYSSHIGENVESVKDLERQLNSLHRQIANDRQALHALEGAKGIMLRKAEAEFQRLQLLIPSHYCLINSYEDNSIIARTGEITITHDGDDFEIGGFKVMINLCTGDLTIENESNKIDDHDHPHIEGGKPCLGNISSGVIKMIAEFELFGALQMIHSFLHSYNPDSAYTKIQRWDPNYENEEDNRFERCSNDNSGFECVECGGEDGSCQYYENAFEDCRERASLDDCKTCDYLCPLGRTRISEAETKETEIKAEAAA